VNYKKIALVMCLMPSVMVSNDNYEKRIKELEERNECLTQEIKDLLVNEDTLRSDVEHNYDILSVTWCVIGSAIGAWTARIKMQQNMEGIYALTSSVLIGVGIGVLLGAPAEYLARKYLFKKLLREKEIQVKKKRRSSKKNDSEVIA
jgi:hypothetical protein